MVVILSLEWQSPWRRRTEELYCRGRPGFTIALPASAGGLGYVYGSTGQRERENWQSRRGKGSYTLVSRGETPYYAAWLGV